MRIFVPSINRPHHVPEMNRKRGADTTLTWLVPDWQAEAYHAYGADDMILGPWSKSEFMNRVLDRYSDQWCVFSDDDCVELVRLTGDRLAPTTLGDVAREYVRVGAGRGDYLVNMPHMTNRLYMNHSVSSWGPITGWFFAVGPGCAVRFDLTLAVGEDVDFGARVVERYGRLCRPNWIQGRYKMGGPTSNFDHDRDDLPCSEQLARRYPHLIAGWGPPQRPGTSGVLRYKQLPRLLPSVRRAV